MYVVTSNLNTKPPTFSIKHSKVLVQDEVTPTSPLNRIIACHM